jgi:hypothetical protein
MKNYAILLTHKKFEKNILLKKFVEIKTQWAEKKNESCDGITKNLYLSLKINLIGIDGKLCKPCRKVEKQAARKILNRQYLIRNRQSLSIEVLFNKKIFKTHCTVVISKKTSPPRFIIIDAI